ncbi:MAG: GTPase Era [Oligoflexia bacterium]|nr:GTPase Era [Oligoflexia bacterium]
MSKSGFIAIVGRPNAGKSTLLNSVLGAKVSIVTPKAQTTRERVLGILTEKQGQIVFIDTPGIHRAKEGGINAFMVNEAREALESPTLVWYLVDPSSAPKHEAAVLELLAPSKAPVILLFTKSDVMMRAPQKAALERFQVDLKQALADKGIPLVESFRISARRNEGLKQLLALSWERMPEGPFYYPDEEQISDRPVRFFVAEKVREQLFLHLGQELPYSCAVEIESFEEPGGDKKLTRIEAVIHVERESQKGMVIGKGGQKIKEIGQAARAEIERFIEGPAFLGLRVKVLKDWTRNAEALKKMGYHLPEKGKNA